MQEALRSRFELQGIAIAELPEKIEPQILRAGQMLMQALIEESKIMCVGMSDAQSAASHFSAELNHSSQLERPPLPCLSLQGNSDTENIVRQLKSLAQQGDVLICFQGSRPHAEDPEIKRLCKEAGQLGIKSILVGNIGFPVMNNKENLQLIIDKGSRMNYLCSITVIGLTLAALLDHQLFGHPL